ncbi:MAG: hypothetical protein JWO98_81 [Frankiales bacterium]|nr:hypothetical protein [Frankiales bacterium]
MLNGPPRRLGGPDSLARARLRDWVLVLGMHRSGTSAVTETLTDMGLQEPHPADLLVGHPGNPNHHESRSLTAFDEELLAALGGSWGAPPEVGDGWELSGLGRDWTAAAAQTLLGAYPRPDPAVVKDPRMCLLVPFWLGVLGRPKGVLLMWRNPGSVARSVANVSGWPYVHGLALWEVYNRQLLSDLAGQNVFVLSYDDLVADPRAFAQDASAWFDSLGIPDASRPLPSPRTELRHFQDDVGSEDESLLPAHRELVRTLKALGGHHPTFSSPTVPACTAWAAGMLSLRRQYETAHEQVRSRVQTEAELGRLGTAYASLASAVREAGVVPTLPQVPDEA